MYFPFLPPSPPAGSTQNGKLAESTFTETDNINVVLPAPFCHNQLTVVAKLTGNMFGAWHKTYYSENALAYLARPRRRSPA